LSHKYNKFSLTIIGEGEEKDNLLRYINEHNLESNVKIESYRNDILDYYTKFDSLVLSSRYEGIPYTMLDCMAIGLPVIVTDVGGISNVITDKVNGLIVDAESPQKLCEAMSLMANDRELYETLKYNAFKKVKKFSIENMVKEYINLYENEVLNNNIHE
jgi:glycosyltransferase involved in cell wall biosynthesis